MAISDHATILVVDDSDAVCSLIADALERDGYRVLQAPDGAHAGGLLAEEDVDAAILDVRLELEDGVELGREFRLERPDLPIALMSGETSGAEALRRAAGLTDLFLAKPFTLEKLTAAVEELLAQRGAKPPEIS